MSLFNNSSTLWEETVELELRDSGCASVCLLRNLLEPDASAPSNILRSEGRKESAPGLGTQTHTAMSHGWSKTALKFQQHICSQSLKSRMNKWWLWCLVLTPVHGKNILPTTWLLKCQFFSLVTLGYSLRELFPSYNLIISTQPN